MPNNYDSAIAINAGHATLCPAYELVVWHRGRGSLLYDVEKGPKNTIAVAAGWYHFMALAEDGSVQAWGQPFYGQCDVPEELQ